MKTVQAFLCALLLCGAVSAQDLPPDILADQYLLEATRAFKSGDAKEAIRAFGKIEALDTEPPPEFAFFYGKLLVENGTNLDDLLKGQRLLKSYVIRIAKDSEHYTPTLELLLDAGRRLAEEEAKPRQADDEAFGRAKSEGAVGSYSSYLEAYPSGRHVVEARRLRDEAAERDRGLVVGEQFRDCGGTWCPELVVVPAGSYMMGSPSSDEERDDDEGPVHRVSIAEPFAVGVMEVTRGQWSAFVSETGHSTRDACVIHESGTWKWREGRSWRNPGYSQSDAHPVVCVSWEDAQAYVGWLSRKTGEEYRLLSESEWEYVARAGTRTARYWGEGETGQCRYGNGWDKSARWCNDGHVHTAPVGSFEANGYGLHDVLGNVWEWTQDCWNESYAGAPADGSAWEEGSCGLKVSRGGSWTNLPWELRSARRYSNFTRGTYYLGFRVARTLTP